MIVVGGFVLLAGAPILLAIDPNRWAIAFAVASVFFNALIQYINAAQSATMAEVRREEWQQFASLTEVVAGHLSQVLSYYDARFLSKSASMRKDEYKTKLRALQQLLLDHIVQVLRLQLGETASNGVLSANWTMRGSEENANRFRVVVYNKHMTDRQAGQANQWKEIAEGIPGASVAYLTGTVSLVSDINASDNNKHFSPTASYRSILSIPVLCSSSIVGVVNVDSTEIGLLETEQHQLVFDIVYLIGLCQLLHDGA